MDQTKMITHVQYPSNHLFLRGIKILLISDNEAWLQSVTKSFDDTWPEEHLNFYYQNEPTFDIESVSWILMHKNVVDYVIIRVPEKEHSGMSFLIGNFLNDTNVYFYANTFAEHKFFNFLLPRSYSYIPKLADDVKKNWMNK